MIFRDLVLWAVLIGSIFPDCDTRKAMAAKFLPLYIVFKHRGFTHTIGALILFSGILGIMVGTNIGMAFSVGYCSHLVLDYLTPRSLWNKKKKGH